MAKYTDQQLKDMADECLFAYNMNDQRADILIHLISSTFQVHPQLIVQELYKLANKEITNE